MAQFMITYLGGNKPASPEEGMQHMAKYKAWIASLGASVVSPANPIINTHTIHSDGTTAKSSQTSMSGFTVIAAKSIEEAISIAKNCPFLEVGGTLEVSELMQMPDLK